MRVLITGGAGFIGSHLVESYLDKGDEVYIIDDLSTGSVQNINAIKYKRETEKKLYVTIDTILNRDIMLELIGICDVVYHLAAAVGVEYILKHPLETIKINTHGTEMVLELCDKFRKRVLVASTSEVYGKHLHAPLVETDNIVYGPSSKFRWSYAASKLMDEFSSLAYHRTKGLEVIVPRLFNTVGPRQSSAYGMVIPRLVKQALSGAPLTVYGDGKQTRTFTYVKDVVNVLIALMENQHTVGEVYNIGGTEEISIADLARKIVAMTKSTSKIEFIPYDTVFAKDFEDMQRRVPCVEKIKKAVGFVPETSLETILERVIEHFLENKKSGSTHS